MHACMQGCDGAEAGGWWDSGRGHPPCSVHRARCDWSRTSQPPLTTVRDEGCMHGHNIDTVFTLYMHAKALVIVVIDDSTHCTLIVLW